MSDVKMTKIRGLDGYYHYVPSHQLDDHVLWSTCRCGTHQDFPRLRWVHQEFTPSPVRSNELLKDPETGFGDDDEVVPEKDCSPEWPPNHTVIPDKRPELFISNFTTETMEPTANDIQEGGNHYKEMDIEPWDVIDTWPLEQRIGAYRAGVLKYTMRLGTKDERVGEAKKARHYAEKLAEVLEEASEQLLKQSSEVKGS